MLAPIRAIIPTLNQTPSPKPKMIPAMIRPRAAKPPHIMIGRMKDRSLLVVIPMTVRPAKPINVITAACQIENPGIGVEHRCEERCEHHRIESGHAEQSGVLGADVVDSSGGVGGDRAADPERTEQSEPEKSSPFAEEDVVDRISQAGHEQCGFEHDEGQNGQGDVLIDPHEKRRAHVLIGVDGGDVLGLLWIGHVRQPPRLQFSSVSHVFSAEKVPGAQRIPGIGTVGAVMATKMITTNRQAHRNFEITETVEAGIVLAGSEVKALRESKTQLNDAYARFDNGELYLVGLHIAPYSRAGTHVILDRARRRKLLLHRHELTRLSSKLNQDHLLLVPMAIYFKNGRVKLELGLGRGRKTVDKRQLIAKRDADREARRELADRNR